MPSLRTTTDRIDALADRIASGEPPDRARLEATLTDGYAWALQLDAECGRIERRISTETARLAEETSQERVREVSALARLLTDRRRELDSLRSRLSLLAAGIREAPA